MYSKAPIAVPKTPASPCAPKLPVRRQLRSRKPPQIEEEEGLGNFESVLKQYESDHEKMKLILLGYTSTNDWDYDHILSISCPTLKNMCINLLSQADFNAFMRDNVSLLSKECIENLSEDKLISWIESRENFDEIFFDTKRTLVMFEHLVSKGLLSLAATEDKPSFLTRLLEKHFDDKIRPSRITNNSKFSEMVKFILFFTNEVIEDTSIFEKCSKSTLKVFLEFQCNQIKMLQMENTCLRHSQAVQTEKSVEIPIKEPVVELSEEKSEEKEANKD
jgi:hypothetical protein